MRSKTYPVPAALLVITTLTTCGPDQARGKPELPKAAENESGFQTTGLPAPAANPTNTASPVAVEVPVSPETPPSRGENLLFLVLAALWIDGHGMHLAANSIGHLLKDLAGSDVHTLTDFYDEVLGHYLRHLGVIALSVLLLYRQLLREFSHPVVGIID